MTDPQSSDTASSQQRVIDALRRVSGFITEVTDLNRLLTLIMEESKDLLDSEASSCLLYDKETDELYFEVALGEKGGAVKSIRLPRGTGIAWKCIEENKTQIVNDAQSEKSHFSESDKISDYTTRNLLATPMVFRGEIIGVLEILNKRNESDYDPLDAQILSTVADQAAMAIENARLVERNTQRERLAAIGLSVSSIAHHLKNIMVTIKAPISMILSVSGTDIVENVVANCSPVLQRGSNRMEQSVREMLTFSKRQEPELVQGSVADLLREIVEASRLVAKDKDVELRMNVDEEIDESYLDKLRLHDAFLNIVGNAVEAQPEGALGAWVEVRARLDRENSQYIIEIEDNGPGIPEDQLKKIFQPFFSTKGSRGTGLGLAVARKVAEENGGALTAKSEVGRGATFTFNLPVVSEPAKNPSKEKSE